MKQIVAGLIAALTIVAAPAYPASADPVELDDAGLKQMLENMGYAPTEYAYSTGSKYFSISEGQADLSWTLDFSQGADLVWAVIDYPQLEDGQTFPDGVLLQTLAENDGPKYWHFVYLTNSRQLRLAGNILNRDLKPSDLKTMIDEAVAISSRTQSLWDPTKWIVEASEAKSAAE